MSERPARRKQHESIKPGRFEIWADKFDGSIVITCRACSVEIDMGGAPDLFALFDAADAHYCGPA